MKQHTIAKIKETAKQAGVQLKYNSYYGEFCIAGYYTTCREDAMDTIKHMARNNHVGASAAI